jgi:Ca-activated chloride channel family protein
MPAELHFLSPAWLLALLPLGLLLAVLARRRGGGGAWRRVIDAPLLAALTVGAAGRRRRWPLALLGLGWLGGVLALANPTFERVPVPAFRDAAARVIALDLSRSMLAEDLAPTRLTRARFEVEDILRRSEDGQVGLVVFAGDAFTVVPLTDDAATVRGMLPALEPEIMPAQGSRVDLGIVEALKLLRQAGARGGEVVLLTDGDGGARARSAAAALRQAGHRLAIIGVGTPEGAPVPGVRTARGAVIAQLPEGRLRSLARHGGGAYARTSADDTDLGRVLASGERGGVRADQDPRQAEVWKELGPWLALALLPVAALGFRRGWLLLPALLALNLSAVAPAPVMAAEVADADTAERAAGPEVGLGQRWRDLWRRRDQQAAGALAHGDYRRALQLAEDPARSGAARYRLGDFQTAAETFAAGDSADDHYNRGNALARAGRLEDALAAYDAALARDPDMADALHNRNEVEEALHRQSPPQQQQQDQQAGGGGEQSDPDSQQPSGGGQSGDQAGDQSAAEAASQAAGDGADSGQDRASGDSQAESAGDGAEDPGDAGHQADADQPGAENGEEPPAAGDDGQSGQSAAADAEPDAAGAGAGGEDDGAEQQEASVADAAARRASEERAAADYRDAAAAAEADGEGADAAQQRGDEAAGGPATAAADQPPDPAELERRRAADQWLRRIPDDPAGLLRRKFLYQYRMRAGGPGTAEDPW